MGLPHALLAAWLLVGVIGWLAWLGPQGHLDPFVIFVPPGYAVVLAALICWVPHLRRFRGLFVTVLGLGCVLWLWWLLGIWLSDSS